MTDVLRIALERRDRLHDEVEKLDEFIRVAEELITFGRSRDPAEARIAGPAIIEAEAPDGETEDVFGPMRMNLMRRSVG